MPADCVFCGIVSKKTEAAIVFEDDRTLAFLDRAPLFAGHVLLVPKTTSSRSPSSRTTRSVRSS